MRRATIMATLTATALLVSSCAAPATPELRLGPGAPTAPGTTTWTPASDTVTFSVPVCSVDGSRLAITGVEPARTIGDGFRVLAVRLVRVPDADGAAPATPGFPPSGRRAFVIPVGAPAGSPCAGKAAQHDEVQVALLGTSAAGGGWDGVRVRWSAGTQTGTLEVPWRLLLAGTATA